jgi:hypothetical protein
VSMLSGIDIVVDEVHSTEDERTHTDEAKVKPRTPPKRGKLGKTRRTGWLSKVCVSIQFAGRRISNQSHHSISFVNTLQFLPVLPFPRVI